MRIKGIPVVMYHGVGPAVPGWLWPHLFVRHDVFEGQMRILRDRGWNAITLNMLHAHMKDNVSLPENPFILTFDDGYLNNWTYAFPLIRKYGHKAVVWMTTDFIDPSPIPRPTLDDVWNGDLSVEELENRGFLSICEMRKMEEDGAIEIQSHAATHTWYFNGPRIIDFHRPSGVDGYNPPPWLSWNRMPDRKHEYMSARLEDRIPYGTPVYEHGKSLVTKKYFQDQSLDSKLADYVSENGSADFFNRNDWREQLSTIAGKSPRAADSYETDAEFAARVRSELADSKRILEESLGRRVDYLCWPGGGMNQGLFDLAGELGYLATTSLFQAEGRKNLYGEDPKEINRTGCGAPWHWKGRLIHRTDPGFFLNILRLFNGETTALWKLRAYKLKYVILSLLSPSGWGEI